MVSDIKITLTKSLASQNKNRVATAKSLGLRKMQSTVIQPDNSATRGKIRKIKDLISIEQQTENNEKNLKA